MAVIVSTIIMAYGFSGGSDRVYALEVGLGQTLSAEVSPEGDWDATVTISADAADLRQERLFLAR